MRKLRIKTISLILLSLLTVSLFSSCAIEHKNFMTIIDNGESNYKIVISAQDDSPVKNAASELQKYISQISGKTLEIVTDEVGETKSEIVLGRTARGDFGIDYTALGDDGYAVKVVDNKIVIAGGLRGVIYGVYGFLRDELGCGFYARDCEYIPSSSTVKILDNVNRVDIPVFSDRWAYWDFYYDTDSPSAMKLGLNPNSKDWGSDWKIHASTMGMHTINYLLSGVEDPKMHTYNKQPCVSSDENYNKILEHAIAWIERQINAYGRCDILDVSQNDGPGGWCTCQRCTELNNLYGKGLPTGSWWYFINRIATDVHKIYPNIEIVTYAYEDTRPPVDLEIVDGVSAFVATGNGTSCVTHGIGKCDVNANSDFEKALDSWRTKLQNIYIYEYLGCPSEFNMTNPNLYSMHDNFKLFADKGAYSVTCFATDDVAADFVALRYYLMSRLNWNPYITDIEYENLINDFCKHYYGNESGKYVKKFIDLVMETFGNEHVEIVYGYDIKKEFPITKRVPLIYPDVTDEMLNDQNFDWVSLFKLEYFADTTYTDAANALFDKAEELAEDEIKLNRIELAHIQVQYYELYMFDYINSSFRLWADTMNKKIGSKKLTVAMGIERYKQLNKELWQTLRAHGVERISEKVEVMDNPNFAYNPKDWNK